MLLFCNCEKTLNEGNVIEAIHTCEKTEGTISNIVKAGLSKHNRGKEEIENAMEIAGFIEISQFKKMQKSSQLLHISRL